VNALAAKFIYQPLFQYIKMISFLKDITTHIALILQAVVFVLFQARLTYVVPDRYLIIFFLIIDLFFMGMTVANTKKHKVITR
jgi:hypothetical protein